MTRATKVSILILISRLEFFYNVAHAACESVKCIFLDELPRRLLQLLLLGTALFVTQSFGVSVETEQSNLTARFMGVLLGFVIV